MKEIIPQIGVQEQGRDKKKFEILKWVSEYETQLLWNKRIILLRFLYFENTSEWNISQKMYSWIL